ncbi:MAG: DUF6077 domain-containing protein [Eubacteriales bacterium]|nr:DUF6077 domain-containing protein [Eubacteriales bacterium]
MGFLVKLFLFLVWAVAAPCALGLLPCALLPKEKRTVSVLCLSGYCVTFSLFALVYMPMLLLTKEGRFTPLVVAFTIVSLAAIAAGGVLCGGRGGVTLSLRKPGREEALLWAVFAALLLFELYMAYTRASFDGDDAYYVVESVLADQQDSMYRILPYTGGATSLDARHALAGLPMWIAYLARMTGAHATILTHSLLPLLLIPLTDLAFYGIAKRLFEHAAYGSAASGGRGGEGALRCRLPAFMIVIALFQIFGNVSIYTPETFLLMRTWQGKSVFANLIVPVAFLLLLWIAKAYREQAGGKERLFLWIWLLCLNLAAGLCTSMAVALLTLLLGAGAFWISAANRNFRILRDTVIVCIPNALHMALLLFLH